MAVSKIIDSTSLTIEIQSGVDKAGDPTYSKKNFGKIRNDISSEDLYEVAEAIKSVMDVDTRDTLVNVTSSLVKE